MKALSILRSWVFALLLAAAVWPSPGEAAGTARLTVETADGRSLDFAVELAQTPEEQTLGLMNRRSLAPDGGMLFDFGSDRLIVMWMKNTLIPLDMLFIAADGKIIGIAERTVPMSLETIPSPGPARAVLEVNGGTAERLRVHVGDRVSRPAFGH